MNKTIHELTELTEVAESDELIVYNVSDATSKKVNTKNILANVFRGLPIVSSTETLKDLNKIINAGQYTVEGTALNRPTSLGNAGGTLFVFGHKPETPSSVNQWIYQILISGSSNKIWLRISINPNSTTPSNWSSWQVISGSLSSGNISINANVSSGTINYVKKGNLCTVNLSNISLVSWTGGDRTLNSSTTKLPKPIVGPYFSIPPINDSTPSQVFYISTVGDLWAGGGVSQSGSFYGSFTYICED